MFIIFICSLLISFTLTILVNVFRTLRPQMINETLKDVGPLFFYRSFHRLFFSKREFPSLAFSALIAKFLFLFIAIGSGILVSLRYEHFEALLIIATFLLTFFVADFFPRILAHLYPVASLKIATPLASLALFVTFPFHAPLLKLFKKWISIFSEETHQKETAAHIAALLDDSTKATIDNHNRKLLHAVIAFKDRIVREVMVPRVQVFSLSHTTSILEAAKTLLVEGYSRVPIYKDNIDSIIGILMYKDILGLFVKGASLEGTVESLVKPAFYTPETKKVSQLLQEFRSKQMHLAIVVDEYGGTEGLVTIEDILEEIVGDISDEYDEESVKLFRKESGGALIVDARMGILDLEDHAEIQIPQNGDYDTIGGYIYHKAGAIPKKGFKIYHENFELEVLSATDRAIDKIRIVPRTKPTEEHEEKE